MHRLRLFLALALFLPACRPGETTTAPLDHVVTRDAADATAPAKDPQLVHLGAALDRSVITADADSRLTARLRVTADTAKGLARPPLSLVLVVDTSGSMAGTPIADARTAAMAMVDALHQGDRIAVVTFDSRAEVLVPPVSIGADAKTGKAAIRAKIERMEARGTTDLAAGLQTTLGQFGGTAPEAIRRIVLLSDGVPNHASTIPGLAESARASGIAIAALGLGLEYDETLLGQIARASGGSFRRIDEDDTLAQAFVDEVFRVERVVASNVLLSLQAGPGVEIQRVLGHPIAPGGATQSIALGELAEGQHQDVFVELTVTGHRAGANVELLDATINFDERTASAGRIERRSFVAVKASDDKDVIARGRDAGIERDAARARVATAILDAIALSRAADFAGARDLLEASEKDAKANAKDDPELRAQLDELTKLRKTFASEAKAQAAAQRELSRGAAPGKAPMPAPVSPEDALSIKRSHARAIEVVQPQTAPASR